MYRSGYVGKLKMSIDRVPSFIGLGLRFNWKYRMVIATILNHELTLWYRG